VAFCPAAGRLVAQSPALSPAHAPAEPESDQARRASQTPGMVAVSHVEPYDERRVAACHGGGPVRYRQSLLYSGSQLGLLQYNGILYYRISDVIFSAIVLWRERIVHRLCTPLDKVSYGL